MQLLLATSQWHTAHTRTCGWVHGTHMEPGPILGNWEQGRACFLGFLWLKSKNLGHHRKLNAGTIKQCRVISLSPSPQLRIFYKSNSHRAKFSAHRTPGVWLLWCWQSSFMLRREYLRGSFCGAAKDDSTRGGEKEAGWEVWSHYLLQRSELQFQGLFWELNLAIVKHVNL